MAVFDDVTGGDGRDGDENIDEFEPEDREDGHEDVDVDEGQEQKPRRRNRPSQSRRERDRIRSLEGQFSQLTELVKKGGLAVNAPKDAPDVDAIRQEILAEVQGRANQQIVTSRAEAALERAGFRGDSARGVRMLDLRNIDPGDRDAILDAIEELKDDSPELFGRVRRSRPVRDRDDDDDDGYRPRESSRPVRSRERMARERGNGAVEQDGLAAMLSQVVGRRPRE